MTSLSTDSPSGSNNRRRTRPSTRKKIERLVEEGTKNYPAYLKLIYTGDSEQSEEEEGNTDGKGEVAKASVVRATGDGQASVETVVSPESVKLLDPGKEKATTPTGVGAEDEEEEGEPRGKRPSGEPTELDEIRISDDDTTQGEELERIKSQPSIEEKWKIELFQLQDDIVSLKAMLNGKLQVAAELKQRLGISPMTELKHELKHSLQSLKESGTIAKTNALLRSFGAYASRKMGSIRNSLVFKSVEERVGNVKSKSMVHLRSKLHRKLPASKSDSHVGELQTTDGHLVVASNDTEDQNETDTLANSRSPSKILSSDILGE